MITFSRLLTTLYLFFNVSAFTVDCCQDGYRGTTPINGDLPAFEIPEDVQPGQKVWESGDINITVYCDNAPGWTTNNPSENIYAWIKLPQINNADMLNDPYLTFGVTYNGVDYEGTNERIDAHICPDRHKQYYNGHYYDPVYNDNTLQKNVTFNVHFRVYVKFRSRLVGDQTVNFDIVSVLRSDGEGGANMSSNAKNLRYVITGLDNILFFDCSIDVRILPESQIANLEQIAANSIAIYQPRAALSIPIIKDIAADCTKQSDVAISFYTADMLHDDTHLGMGNGLLMRITDQKTQEDIKSNRYKRFTTYIPGQTGAMVTRDYQAKPPQRPGETLVYGPLKRDLIIRINYD